MPIAGEKVEKGTYECVICGFHTEIEDGDELEFCPLCEGARFEKISDYNLRK